MGKPTISGFRRVAISVRAILPREVWLPEVHQTVHATSSTRSDSTLNRRACGAATCLPRLCDRAIRQTTPLDPAWLGQTFDPETPDAPSGGLNSARWLPGTITMGPFSIVNSSRK